MSIGRFKGVQMAKTKKDPTVGEIFDTLSEDQRAAVEYIVGSTIDKDSKGLLLTDVSLFDLKESPTVGEVYDTLTGMQRTVLDFIVGISLLYDINSKEFKDINFDEFTHDQLLAIRQAGRNFLVYAGLALRCVI